MAWVLLCFAGMTRLWPLVCLVTLAGCASAPVGGDGFGSGTYLVSDYVSVEDSCGQNPDPDDMNGDRILVEVDEDTIEFFGVQAPLEGDGFSQTTYFGLSDHRSEGVDCVHEEIEKLEGTINGHNIAVTWSYEWYDFGTTQCKQLGDNHVACTSASRYTLTRE